VRKTTPSEALVLFIVFMAGTSTSTLLAWYYPDSPAYNYAGAFTVALILVLGFFMARKKNAD
jgi:hypothetical protein